MKNQERKYISREDALKKLQRYCAYQDRCHQEVRNKLLNLGIYGDELEEIIIELIADNFLNEERYACSFARGKFRIKSWGRIRIKQELKRKKVSAYCIKKAMEEIEESDYLEKLKLVLDKKAAQLSEADPWKKRTKLAQYAIGRGFESQLVFELVNAMG